MSEAARHDGRFRTSPHSAVDHAAGHGTGHADDDDARDGGARHDSAVHGGETPGHHHAAGHHHHAASHAAQAERVRCQREAGGHSLRFRQVQYPARGREGPRRQCHLAQVESEGHCDERGTNEYNLALGERRAKSTLNYLVAQGVQASRITIISYGKERPACTEHNEACWSKNRRAHFLTKAQ